MDLWFAKFLVGEDPVQPLDMDQVLAAYLCGRANTAPWAGLNEIDSSPYLLTPARGAALFDLLGRYPIPPPELPQWTQPGQNLDLCFNNVRLTDLLGQSTPSRPDLVSHAVLTKLQAAIPRLSAFRLSCAKQWQEMVNSLKMCGNDRQSKHTNILMLVPPEAASFAPVPQLLLTRQVALTPTSYVTLAPTSEYVEVALDPTDSRVLKLLAAALMLENWRFMALLTDAFRRAWPGSDAMCRFANEIHSNQGKFSYQYTDPGSEQSGVIVGVRACVFMSIRRRSTSELLELGIGDQRPVHLLVQVPPIPRGYLRALIEDAGGAPVRLLLGTDMSYVRLHLVLGPLPRNWHRSEEHTS